MKLIYLFILFSIPISAMSQKVDTSQANKLVDSLLTKASYSEGSGNFAEMLSFSEEAGKYAEKSFGRVSVKMSECLSYAGWAKMSLGDLKGAENLLLESKNNCESIVGKGKPDCLTSLNDLSTLYSELCRYKEAEDLLLQTKIISEKYYGKEDQSYTRAINNLGTLYNSLSRYEEAEPLLIENLNLRKKTKQERGVDYARAELNLSDLYHHLGRYKESEILMLDAKEMVMKNLGKENGPYATCLNNLAGLYIDINKLDDAEKLLIETVEIRLKIFGNENVNYAMGLNNLANIYDRKNKFQEAEKLYLEAGKIIENKLGREHPNFAYNLNNLGECYEAQALFEKAEKYLVESKNLREKILGREHQDYITQSLNNLILLYLKMNKLKEAEDLLIEEQYLTQKMLIKATKYFSEKELNQYLNKYLNKSNRNLNLAYTELKSSSKIIEICLNNSIFYKGFLLQNGIEIRKKILADPLLKDKFELLSSYRMLLDKEYLKPISMRKSELINEFESLANLKEKELANSIMNYEDSYRVIDWTDIKKNLNANNVIVEFVRFRYDNPIANDSILYVALILSPEDKNPHYVYLCAEKKLNNLLNKWDDKNQEVSPSAVYWPKQGEQSLYDLIWKPIENIIPAGSTIWYSPTGLLHRLNLGAISKNRYESLDDIYNLRRVGSTRQIAQENSQESIGNEAALFGGLKYDADTLSLEKSIADLGMSFRTSENEEIKAISPDGTRNVRDGSVNYLPHTLTEVQNISKQLNKAGFKVTTYSAYSGTEEAFFQIGQYSKTKKSPRILHLATHGYFFPDPKEDSSSIHNMTDIERNIPFRASDNPFIRSGLLLSGSEHAWKTGTPASPKLADGILTAADIANMDLSNTELAVLSACETGLGDIENNEGVFGLQRAFKIAGVRYLIMSLWKVDDNATMELMTSFYSKWLDKKHPLSVPEAFRSAQAEMRKKNRNPYFWAGFVLVE
ncbi:MAG TPA: CHAT domain-containing tetratricopeptide repeat protein [Saprospiraceae bacterium]|nr:CHAT domain-containing tetratricopeptide repeat protein [Saprospiraceae bacterium]